MRGFRPAALRRPAFFYERAARAAISGRGQPASCLSCWIPMSTESEFIEAYLVSDIYTEDSTTPSTISGFTRIHSSSLPVYHSESCDPLRCIPSSFGSTMQSCCARFEVYARLTLDLLSVSSSPPGSPGCIADRCHPKRSLQFLGREHFCQRTCRYTLSHTSRACP